MPSIFLGRQPIFDRKLQVYGYELLFRRDETNRAGSIDGDQATSQVIINTFMEIGLEKVVGSHLAFINLTRGFLLGQYPISLPPDKVILEVLEDTTMDASLLAALTKLWQQGYKIALDDFVFRSDLEPLVIIADIIKIDTLSMNRQMLHQQVKALQPYHVKLLAEKLETHEDLAFCQDLGFNYFQGYFLCRPNVIKGRGTPANRLAIIHLLTRLQDPHIEVLELAKIINQDVSLSYRLLRYINSAFFGYPRKIESVSQAVIYLGIDSIKTWIILLSLAGIGDKPRELTVTALIRAKFCEGIAIIGHWPHPENFFTVGLLSVLDALLDMPMSEVIDQLPLSEVITHALLHYKGQMGVALGCALAYERGDWQRIDIPSLSNRDIQIAYIHAISWANQANQALEEE